MKIGIFGGSYNPPHNMHLDIAQSLINGGYLDKVIYIPTGDSYNKKGLINFKDRYRMVELMISDYNNLSLSDIGNNEDYKYTYQTLDYFKNIYKNDELYFICGTDNLNEFDTWREYEYVLKNYKLLVIKRNDDNVDSILSKYKGYEQNIVISNIKPKILSSTIIRNNISDDNIKKYLDKKVYKYIVDNELYKS